MAPINTKKIYQLAAGSGLLTLRRRRIRVKKIALHYGLEPSKTSLSTWQGFGLGPTPTLDLNQGKKASSRIL